MSYNEDEDAYYQSYDLEEEYEYIPEEHPEDFCPYCGKEYEDFSDYGCPACDMRVPLYGDF